MEDIYRIKLGDCLELMKQIPDNGVDLTVTSPPYDNLRKYNGNISQLSFDKFKEIAKELYRITKDGGVVVWVVGDATVKGSETGTSFKQALWFKECGFNLHDTMIYQKNNPVPQADKTRYTQSFEYMFVFSKGKIKTINRIMIPCEHFGKIHYGKNKANSQNCDRAIDRAVKETKPKTNIWTFNVGTNQSSKDKATLSHPAIFPEQLANDHIISWSNEGDTVFDPFMGSGTTGKMAIKNNRKFLGFEIDEQYFEIAKNRLKKTEATIDKCDEL